MRSAVTQGLLLVVAALAGAGGAVVAQRHAGTDKAATEAVVRDYILANPEILPQAMQRLQAKEAGKAVAANRAAIVEPFPGASPRSPARSRSARRCRRPWRWRRGRRGRRRAASRRARPIRASGRWRAPWRRGPCAGRRRPPARPSRPRPRGARGSAPAAPIRSRPRARHCGGYGPARRRPSRCAPRPSPRPPARSAPRAPTAGSRRVGAPGRVRPAGARRPRTRPGRSACAAGRRSGGRGVAVRWTGGARRVAADRYRAGNGRSGKTPDRLRVVLNWTSGQANPE